MTTQLTTPRKTVIAILLITIGFSGGTVASCQSNEWTWMGGSQIGDQNPDYGIQGVSSPSNTPGFRAKPAVWVDQKGLVWMFSGGPYLWDTTDGLWVNQSGAPNDLWQFNPATAEWTWLQGNYSIDFDTEACRYGCVPPPVYGTLGTPAPGNIPGGRSTTASWVDDQGNFWLFGSERPLQAVMDDLWKFNPTSMEWAWMGGNSTPAPGTPWKGIFGTRGQFAATNIPGSRYGAVSWTDLNGNFWLFGGSGIDGSGNAADLNDLWEYDPVKGQWAWVAGNSSASNQHGSPGIYGIPGVPDPHNTPGGREFAVGWRDQSGNLWLFGGSGEDSASNSNFLNDLWKFDITAKAWAWMGGVSTMPCDPSTFACRQPAQYGTLGVEAPDNLPGGRTHAIAWVDNSGNAWVFGGVGSTSTVVTWNVATLNDLWMFDTASLQWKWMGGYNFPSTRCYSGPTKEFIVPIYCAGVEGSYGILGAPDPGNYPGGRGDAVNWVGTDGSLWLYSGENFNEAAIPGFPPPRPLYNDLWRFVPSDSTLPPAVTPLLSAPSGNYTAGGPLAITNGMSNASIYYTTDGSTPSVSSTLYTGPIEITTSQTVKAIAIAPGYPDSGIASATYNVLPPAAAPAFSIAGGTYNSVQTVSISDATPGASILYATDGSGEWSLYSAPLPSLPLRRFTPSRLPMDMAGVPSRLPPTP